MTAPIAESAPSPIAARIERLPLGKFHRRFITLVSLGTFFDLYDIFVVAYIGAALLQSGFLSLKQFSFFVASGFLGMFFGTIFFGMGSDRWGRRVSFITLLLIYSVFTLAGAFAPSAGWLIAMRFFAGLGIGAEIVVIGTYVTELVPSHARGRYVAITQVAGFMAVPVAAILSRLLVPTHFLIAGWRWVMVIGASGALLTWWFRRRLPESPRWLESQGLTAEADRVMRALETEPLPVEAALPVVVAQESGTVSRKLGTFAELWRPPYLRRTVMLILFQMLQTIGFYGFANWAPTFLLKRGFSLLHSLEYTMLIALVSPVGPMLAAWTSDRLERKWTIVVLALLVAAFGLGFGNARTPAAVVTFGALLTLCNYWFSAAFHAFQAELFPTRIRATGVGFTYSWSRLSAAFTSLLIGAVLAHGVPAVFALLAAAMTGVAVIIAVLGPRTNRVALEELSG
ncbi:MAG: ydjE [Candidatus Acidoferrum typicum]|nr:ydjE [Candidatus Acidoferrum typicum]